MKIIRASTAGFCMGVALALRTLDKAIESRKTGDQGRILTLGAIIHNPQVLEEYAHKGVVCIHDLSEVLPQDTVVIRAHGIPRADENFLHSSGALVFDATCPRVKEAQMAIANASAEGQSLLLFGEADHPEVIGLISYAGGPYMVFGSVQDFLALHLNPDTRYVLAAQTTQDSEEFKTIAAAFSARFPLAPVLSTICDATGKRQAEALRIAAQVDAMVVIGGLTSGNTRRLAALTANAGVSTWHVESPDELPMTELEKKCIIGLTAGASTPKRLIDETQFLLESKAGNCPGPF